MGAMVTLPDGSKVEVCLDPSATEPYFDSVDKCVHVVSGYGFILDIYDDFDKALVACKEYAMQVIMDKCK